MMPNPSLRPSGEPLMRASMIMRIARQGLLVALVLALALPTYPATGRAAVVAPTLVGPSNGSELPKMTATLSWQLPTGATQYHLQVIPALNDGPGVNVIRGAASEFVVPPPPEWYGLLPGMSYTWRVRATDRATFAPEDDPSWSPWSDTWSFRTPTTTSSVVQVVTPAEGTQITAEPSTLTWSHPDPAIIYFEVQVSGDSGFDTSATASSFVWWNLVHDGVAMPANAWTTSALEPGSQYYWRVRPRVQGDGTPLAWSQTFSFRTTFGNTARMLSRCGRWRHARCPD